MAFIGRWFSSFATAYREMNQATLTGAIDVIVVRQPDGSLRASPFHVRFGKAGILRPRDKVVDIILNGEPVDLKMKLGDAGEAFFVELKDDESTVAPYLCTSPLPGDDAQRLMEQGLAEMRNHCDMQQNTSQSTGDAQLSEFSKELLPQTGSKSKSTTTTTNSDESGKETEDVVNVESTDNHRRASATEGALVPPSTPQTPRLILDDGFTTPSSALPIDASSTSSKTPTKSRPTALDTLAHLSTDGGDESSFGAASSNAASKSKMFRRKRKKSNSKKSPVSTTSSTTTTSTAKVSTQHEDSTPQTETFGDDIFVCEIDPSDEGVHGGSRNGVVGNWSSDDEEIESPHSEPAMTNGSLSNDNSTVITMSATRTIRTASADVGVNHFDYRQPSHSFSHKMSRSLPQDVALVASGRVIPDAPPPIAAAASTKSLLVNDIRGKLGFGYVSDNKGGAYSLGDTPLGELHPFSDGDLTPPMGSPFNRPFSPQSDSELLDRPTHGSKANRFSNVNWSWGQLPCVSHEYDKLPQVNEEFPESQDSTAFETPSQTPIRDIPEEGDKGDATLDSNLDASYLIDQVVPVLPSDSTTTTTANDAVAVALESKKTPPGLTLEELEQAEPQVKALYLSQPTRNESYGQSIGKALLDRRSETLKDDDAESATGSSLPQSPRQFEYGGGAGSSGFGSDAEGHSTVNRDNSHPTSPCCRHHQFLSKHQSEDADECECDVHGQSCGVDVGSPRPPSSPSPDFIGSETSSPSHSSQNPEILLSLCGGLHGNKKMSDECFMLSLITFDEFCEDPEGILANPDLVVKVGNHYYTWLVAAPVLLSMGAFGRPLPSAAVNVLLNKHQPESEERPTISDSRKKSTGGVASWFYWGSKDEEPVHSSSAPNMTSLEEVATPLVAAETVPMYVSTQGDPLEVGKEPTEADADETQSSVKFEIEIEDGVVEGENDETQRLEYIKSIRLTPEQLAKLPLKEGANDVVFSVTTSYQGTTRAEASIFLWNYDDKLIISDIDGTITRSDVLGQIMPLVGNDWSQDGITSLYRHIVENGYRIIYLSARAIGQAGITRSYLQSIRQESNCLPNGPLLLSPSSLFLAFHREVIEKKPEEFKIGCLQDIAKLFPWRDGASMPTLETEIHTAKVDKVDADAKAAFALAEVNKPFFAGFGNKSNDVVAYKAVEVPYSRIFTVNYRGEICHELLKNYRTSYTSLKDMADHVFPFIFKGESYLVEKESPKKTGILLRATSRSESDAAPPYPRPNGVSRLRGKERSYSTVEMPPSSSPFSSSFQNGQQQFTRSRRSDSAAPKCFFYEGEQYSSFAYWKEPLVNMDDEISGLAEAMKL